VITTAHCAKSPCVADRVQTRLPRTDGSYECDFHPALRWRVWRSSQMPAKRNRTPAGVRERMRWAGNDSPSPPFLFTVTNQTHSGHVRRPAESWAIPPASWSVKIWGQSQVGTGRTAAPPSPPAALRRHTASLLLRQPTGRPSAASTPPPQAPTTVSRARRTVLLRTDSSARNRRVRTAVYWNDSRLTLGRSAAASSDQVRSRHDLPTHNNWETIDGSRRYRGKKSARSRLRPVSTHSRLITARSIVYPDPHVTKQSARIHRHGDLSLCDTHAQRNSIYACVAESTSHSRGHRHPASPIVLPAGEGASFCRSIDYSRNNYNSGCIGSRLLDDWHPDGGVAALRPSLPVFHLRFA